MIPLLRHFLFVTLCLSILSPVYSDDDFTFQPVKWEWGGEITGKFSHASFRNWTADGGDYAYDAGITTSLEPRWADSVWSFNASWDGRYSVMGGKSFKFKKTEDKLEINLKFGRNVWTSQKKTEAVYLVAFGDLQTQFAPQFDDIGDPSQRHYISNFMSPGFITDGISMDYRNNFLGLSIAATPLASKITMVYDKGVDKSYYQIDSNHHYTSEAGAYARITFQNNIGKKTTVSLKTILFKDYTKRSSVDLSLFGEIDVQVFSFLKIYASLNMINDDDINIRIYEDIDHDGDDDFAGVGKRLQICSQIGLGISFSF